MHNDSHGDEAPLDPFLADGNDPAAIFDADGAPEPLDQTELQMIREDLADLDIFQRLLAPRGVKGIVVDCDGCGEIHYFAWEIMRANLKHMMQVGQSRVHEPPHDPKVEEFVSWDYARGYADALESTQLHLRST